MATVDSQQSWLPYDRRSKGCSQGFCSIYCPQWCYALFPPPAPLSLSGAEDDAGTALSPLVIAIISILATALLLVSYYIFVSKRSASPFLHRQTIHLEEPSAAANAVGEEGVGGLHDDCHLPHSSEQEEALINTVWRYKRGEGLVEGTDCSVCLSEFMEEESIRLLPKCSHAFHLQCIDTWLKSHPNCPLCRVNVMSATPAKSERESRIAAALAAEQEREIVVIIEDAERTEEEEEEEEGHNGTDIVEIGEEEDAASHRRPISIADVLQESMEEEYAEGKDCELAEGGGPWRRSGGEQSTGGGRSRRLRCAVSPVQMKRSVSSGRSFFARQGKGNGFASSDLSNG